MKSSINKIVYVLIVSFIFFGTLEVSGQSLSTTDLTTVNVDELSDEQILGYIKQAESSGYTQTQLEAFARQRGMPESQITKLRRRVQLLKSGVKKENDSESKDISSGRSEVIMSESQIFGKLGRTNSKELTATQAKIFGYDLFQSDNLTFAPNLNIPTPVDYVLGPGDELIIDLWGTTNTNIRLMISPEGMVHPERLSPIYLNGLTIEKAKVKLVSRLAQSYSGLIGQNGNPPTIFHQVSLGNIRTINVTVVGEVNNPGNYALNSLSTMYTALHAVGGVSENGTFRAVRLIRDNQLIIEIDLYDFLTGGYKKGDERLRNGDVIVVRPFVKRVEVEGEVRRPGLFELKGGETISDLLNYAGGFTSSALKNTMGVLRKGSQELEFFNIDSNEFSSFQLVDGDLVTIMPILNRYSNRVIIDGAVMMKGWYQLTEGFTLKQLIEKAGGVQGDAYMERITIYRTNSDFSQSTIPVNLKSLLAGETPDIPLQKEDLIKVSSIYDLREEYHVQIRGEVAENGVYAFFNQMTVQDLIILAGGLKESASGASIEIARRNKVGSITSAADIINISIDKDLNLRNEDRSITLKPFDQVFIRRSPGYSFQRNVGIEGEVVAPGAYTISKKDERVSDIIKRAKGLSPYAYPKGAILIRRTEFSAPKSTNELTINYLERLRQKVTDEDSGLMNEGYEKLVKRLDKLEERVINNGEVDNIGSRIKKDLVEDASKQDSLVRDLEIKVNEPVAVDLEEILNNPGSKFDFIVKPGDVISIPGKLETVRIAGEVTSPINIRYDKSYSFKDYINESGGFMQASSRARSYVQYPNGARKGVKRFLWFKKYPKIEPGSTIFVSRKPERRGASLQEVLAITSSLTTLVFLVQQIRQ